MTSSFQPPSLDELPKIDRSGDRQYGSACVEIVGVISPDRQGAIRAGEYWVHHFGFSAWRRIGQALVDRELRILRPVDVDRRWASDFAPSSLQRFRVLISDDETRALFVEALTMDTNDPELSAAAQQSEEPVVLVTSRFGELCLDECGYFEGAAEWNGEEVEIRLRAETDEEIAAVLKAAEALWDAQSEWRQRVEEYAVRELLPLKNEYWLDDNEAPLTAAQFKERMALSSISVAADGGIEFWHYDGNMFREHSILIAGSLAGGLDFADIPG